MFAGEGDEIIIANESAGFGADNEEDVWAGAEPRGSILVSDDCLASDGAANGGASLFWVCRGDDGREKTLEASDDLLGVNGAAIVLVDVRAELVVLRVHGG